MRKHKNKITAVAVILPVLAAAFIFGGNFNDPGIAARPAPDAPPSATFTAADETAPGPAVTGAPVSESPPGLRDIPDVAAPATAAENPETEPGPGTEAERQPAVPPGEPGEALSAGQPGAISEDGSFTVTLSVRCDTLLNNTNLLKNDLHELVPQDGSVYFSAAVTAYVDESVFNVLQREMRRAGIHMESVNTPVYNSAFVEGINNLYAFDAGELSGWIYKVNGLFPDYGCSRHQVKPGDVIEWHYTCDLGRDLDGYTVGGWQRDA